MLTYRCKFIPSLRTRHNIPGTQCPLRDIDKYKVSSKYTRKFLYFMEQRKGSKIRKRKKQSFYEIGFKWKRLILIKGDLLKILRLCV
jgi:hypothetical protein